MMQVTLLIHIVLDVDAGGPKEPCIRWGPVACHIIFY